MSVAAVVAAVAPLLIGVRLMSVGGGGPFRSEVPRRTYLSLYYLRLSGASVELE